MSNLKHKKMKKLLIVLIGLVFASCVNVQTDVEESVNQQHPDFEKNKEIAQNFIDLHFVEDWEAQAELVHEDLDWSPPMYGSENYGKAEHVEAMKMYQQMFDNIKFEADYWLPGVDQETRIIKKKKKTYGTWTGVHTESGKEWALKSYHPMAFKDGKIIGGGDYFDFGGFMASFQE